MPTIDIIINAVDNATAEIKQIAGDLSGAIVGGAADLQGAWDEYKGTIGDVYRISKQAYDETVGVTLEYADQVERIKGYMGDTTESASVLLQVAGNFKISVGDLESALNAMAKNGIDPSLEGLAEIADHYVDLEDPLDRAQYLIDLFGKNAGNMAPLVSAGGDAIREMGKAMHDDPPLTEEDQQAIEEYERAVGDLEIAMRDLKVEVGTKLIPVLTGLLTGWKDERDQMVEMTGTYDEYIGAMNLAGLSMYALTQEQYDAKKAADDLTIALDEIPKDVKITVTETHRRIFEDVMSYWQENQYIPEGHAAGGPVSAGRPYIVGEAGPELFVPGQSGSIIPNDQMGGVSINITYAPGISLGSRQELVNNLQPIVIQAVRDAKMKGALQD